MCFCIRIRRRAPHPVQKLSPWDRSAFPLDPFRSGRRSAPNPSGPWRRWIAQSCTPNGRIPERSRHTPPDQGRAGAGRTARSGGGSHAQRMGGAHAHQRARERGGDAFPGSSSGACRRAQTHRQQRQSDRRVLEFRPACSGPEYRLGPARGVADHHRRRAAVLPRPRKRG